MLDLSIVLITYNRASLLQKTLTSLSQSILKDSEITILDNASEDETSDICKSFISKFNALKIITHPLNIGGNANILRAYEYGTKHYTWICCDDDILDLSQDHVADMISTINEKKADIIRISDVGVIESERGSLRTLESLLHDQDSLSFYSFGFVPGVIFRTDAVRRNVICGYKYLYTCYAQLFVLMKSFPLHSQVYTSKKTLLQRGPGVMSIGSEILIYQMDSLQALPTEEAKKIAMGRRKKIQSLKSFYTGFFNLIMCDFRLRRNRRQIAKNWWSVLVKQPTILGKIIIFFNGIAILVPIKTIVKILNKNFYSDKLEIEKRGIF